jgi:hypothetical protein
MPLEVSTGRWKSLSSGRLSIVETIISQFCLATPLRDLAARRKLSSRSSEEVGRDHPQEECTVGEESKIRDTAEAIKTVLEAAPIYPDAVQPAAKEFGRTFQPAGAEFGMALATVAKAVNVALAPLRGLIWGWDKIEEIVIPAIGKRFEKKLRCLVEPPLTVAGPALEALRFAGPVPALREMYINLLATSMDSETVHKAHPAFVEIIKQLSPDEARLFSTIAQMNPTRICPVSIWATATEMRLSDGTRTEAAQCDHHDLLPSYFANLHRLGLVEDNTEEGGSIPVGGGLMETLLTGTVCLTSLGMQFWNACGDTHL